MPDIFGELERDLGYLIHPDEWGRHGTREMAPIIDALITPSQAPAAMPVNLGTTPQQEEDMSLSADMHALATRLEAVGEEAVTKLEAVAANPATADVFTVLHQLTGLPIDPATISEVATGLSTLVKIYAPVAAPAA